MIALTSISPSHRLGTEHQQACIKSLQDAGYVVYSLNKPEECGELKSLYKDVVFVPTDRHHEKLLGRPYILISALLDFAKTIKDEHFLLLNSDIEIEDKHNVTDKLKTLSDTGVVYLHRYNYNQTKENAAIYNEGIDGFFIHKKWLNIFPQSLMCMGQCFWDYWLPYNVARTESAKLYKINEPYLYHKTHPIQYSYKDWEYFGEIMKVESKLFNLNRADKIAHAVRREFNFKTITA